MPPWLNQKGKQGKWLHFQWIIHSHGRSLIHSLYHCWHNHPFHVTSPHGCIEDKISSTLEVIFQPWQPQSQQILTLHKEIPPHTHTQTQSKESLPQTVMEASLHGWVLYSPYWGVLMSPKQTAMSTVKGEEMNDSVDAFRKQCLLYHMQATTSIMGAYQPWLISTLPGVEQWLLIPPGPQIQKKHIKEGMESADLSTDQLLATHSTLEFSILFPGILRSMVHHASYLDAQNTRQADHQIMPACSPTSVKGKVMAR